MEGGEKWEIQMERKQEARVSSEITEVGERVIAGLPVGTPLSVDFRSLTHHYYMMDEMLH